MLEYRKGLSRTEQLNSLADTELITEVRLMRIMLHAMEEGTEMKASSPK
jgi:hypothetical protein